MRKMGTETKSLVFLTFPPPSPHLIVVGFVDLEISIAVLQNKLKLTNSEAFCSNSVPYSDASSFYCITV